MTRWDFVKLMCAIPTCWRFAYGEVAASRKLAGRRIVVIGSGLSGLAAARELQQNGAEVVILEARNRVGGRIWTSTEWQNQPLDMGASWIHGQKGNPLTQLADENDLPRVATSYDRSIIYSTSGAPLSATQEIELRQLSAEVSEIIRGAQRRDTDHSLLETIQPLLLKYRDAPVSLSLIQYILSSEFEQEYAGSVAKLSTHWFDDSEELRGGDVFFPGGFASVTDYLANGLKIEHSQVVTAIHSDHAEVRVQTGRAEFRADHVIITLPLGVLKDGAVQFKPDLPPGKREAISKLGMGVLNKCYLSFDRVFWPENVDWLGRISSHREDWDSWVSFRRALNSPVLLGFTAADRGREIELWDDQRIVSSAVDALKTIFGDKIPNPVGYQISRWASDPFARGSYSYNALGSTPKMREELIRPVANRLFFAGEATSRKHFGTAHGAYLSGIQAARNVLSIQSNLPLDKSTG